MFEPKMLPKDSATPFSRATAYQKITQTTAQATKLRAKSFGRGKKDMNTGASPDLPPSWATLAS